MADAAAATLLCADKYSLYYEMQHQRGLFLPGMLSPNIKAAIQCINSVAKHKPIFNSAKNVLQTQLHQASRSLECPKRLHLTTHQPSLSAADLQLGGGYRPNVAEVLNWQRHFLQPT